MASGLLEPVAEVLFQLRSMRAARGLMHTFKPSAVVQDCDSVPPAIQVAKAAKKNGIPVVTVQSSVVSPPERIAERNLNLEKVDSSTKKGILKWFAESLVVLFWPAFVVRVQGRRTLNTQGPYPVLVGAALGTLPFSNWLQFGGPATAYAVSGHDAWRVLIDYGIEAERIHVCGQPRMDLAVRLRRHEGCTPDDPQGSLPQQRSRVLFATAPWERYGIMTREEKVQLVSRVVHELLATDESIEVTIKRHPLEEPQEYDSEFASQARVTTVSGTDMIDLIGTCDIFVTQVSTAAFFAAAAGRPVVTFDLGGPPVFDLLQRGGIGVHVRNEGELRRAILEIINNPGIFKQSTREMVALESYSRTDGAATAAVAGLVERLVEERRSPGKTAIGDFRIQHADGTAPRRRAGGQM